jgi:hypothetical protein
MRTRAPAPQRRKHHNFNRALPLVAEAGKILMDLRDKPTRMDWLATAVRTIALAVKVHAEHRSNAAPSPWEFFDSDGPDDEWIEVPDEFRRLVLDHVVDLVFDETHWDGDPYSNRIVLATTESERVGWMQSASDRLVDGPYVRRDRESETYAAIGRAVWHRLGTEHVAYGPRGLVRDRFEVHGATTSAQARALRERLAAFRDKGFARSVLLVGPPGTGKSHAIRSIAAALGLSTLRVELAALLDTERIANDDEVGASLDTLVKILRPGAVVLDDIDRVGKDARLLRFLEESSAEGRLVLASANCTATMLGALLRPGRFDEIVVFDKLDLDLLRDLLGPDADLADRLDDLPIAYVREFIARLRVLGRTAALCELEALGERVRAASSD